MSVRSALSLPPSNPGTSTNPNTPQADEQDEYLSHTAKDEHTASVDSSSSTNPNTPRADKQDEYLSHTAKDKHTASADSDSSTNPNTPRADEQDEYLAHTTKNVHTAFADPGFSTIPNTPQTEQDGHDPQATNYEPLQSHSPNNREKDTSLQIAKIPAVVSWGTDHIAEQVFLDLHWIQQGAQASAFFKISSRVSLVGANSARRDGGIRIFIFIPPERIRQLSFSPNPNHKPSSLGRHTVALTFDMFRPPALVLPKTIVLSSKVEEPLSCLYTLAMQSSFIVYAKFKSWTPLAKLAQLCTAVSNHTLSSSKHCGFSVVRTLYQGEGGQVYEGDCLPGPSSFPGSLPPSYANASASPRSSSSQGKRRRGSSVSHEEAPVVDIPSLAVECNEDAGGPPSYDKFHHPVCPSPRPTKRPRQRSPSRSGTTAVVEKEKFCQHTIVQHLTELHKMLSADVGKVAEHMVKMEEQMLKMGKQMTRMEERMIKVEEQINAISQYSSEQIGQVKSEVVAEVGAEVVAEVLPEVLKQVQDEYEQYVDDRVDGIKLEMEEFVDGKVDDVVDKVLDCIQSGTWHYRRATD